MNRPPPLSLKKYSYSSAVGAHAPEYKTPRRVSDSQQNKATINKSFDAPWQRLVDKKIATTRTPQKIHHHAHHRSSGKMDDTDRAEVKKMKETKNKILKYTQSLNNDRAQGRRASKRVEETQSRGHLWGILVCRV